MRRFQSTASGGVKEPSFKTLRLVVFVQAIPFIGFGFMDNAILIIAGDAIDTSLGVMLGISTLCAAAIGNIISDLAGIALGTVIEDFCAQVLKLPTPNLSTAQRQLRSVRFANQLGMALGMTIGCVIGMFPLLFIDSKKSQQMKNKARLESLFHDVITEAKTLIGAESTCLYLRVENNQNNNNNGDGRSTSSSPSHAHFPYKPSVDGDSLFAIQEDNAHYLIPVGRGIVSRAILTGNAWNIHDVHSEADFSPRELNKGPEARENTRDLVVVPVLDGQGRPIAAIRAMNKTSRTHFTEQDVLILTSLASHISVSLQTIYQNQDEDEVRLRDTIRILKEHGIKGIEEKKHAKGPRLFPVDDE